MRLPGDSLGAQLATRRGSQVVFYRNLVAEGYLLVLYLVAWQDCADEVDKPTESRRIYSHPSKVFANG